MINLRYHIVSIVAVFLALAIGILTGTTLLDRATVDVLKGSQRRLDATNGRLKEANEQLRTAIEGREPAMESFGSEILGQLVPGLLDDGPVLILATRGIDEEVVRASQTAIRDGGGSPLGIVWFDARFDLDNPESASEIADALDLPDEEDDDARKAAVIAELTDALVSSSRSPSSDEDEPSDASTTTTVAADITTTTTVDAAAEPSSGAGAGTGGAGRGDDDDPALAVFSTLVDAGLVEWDSPSEGEPGSRTLPSAGLDIVLLSGEGSELRPGRLMHPLARALAERRAGVVIGEVHNRRTDLGTIDDTDAPRRGAFVDALRSDEAVVDRAITIDNVDQPFGRLALVLALSGLPDTTSGSYGVAPSADLPFPTPGG